MYGIDLERYYTDARSLSGTWGDNAGSYYMNVIIFIIRVLKLLFMNYRLILFVVLLIGITTTPASASLTKIATGVPVFIGEVGLDISSALNGCHQIAWWPAGNDTGTTPAKILEIKGDMYNYNISPDLFSGYEGKWYSWDKKPIVPVFEVRKPEFTFRIWDLDHDRDVTGQTVPQSTRITYRIDTNLDQALNSLHRPDANPLDSFYDIRLKGPNGGGITSIYTGSAGGADTLILTFETKPFVKTTPFFWKDGGRWNHTARGGDGGMLYPAGTYTFSASQNLNRMRDYYNDTVGVTISGSKTVTFVPDQPTPTPIATATTLKTTTITAAPTTETTVVTSATGTIPIKKPTWTSTPLPVEISIVALCAGCLWFMLHRKEQR